MYWEKEPLPLPDTTSPHCVEVMAATGIYIHLRKKALGENLRFSFSLPPALKLHHEFLLSTSTSPCSLDLANVTYIVPLLCNTFSTSQVVSYVLNKGESNGNITLTSSTF